jgi:hypothetical protein
MNIEDISVGDILCYWHETLPGDFDPYYVEVLKVCNKQIKIRKENGHIVYRLPDMFEKGDRAAWDELTKRPVS